MTGKMGAQAAAQWLLDRPQSSTQWSIVKQGSSGSVLCSKGSPAMYNQPALEVLHRSHSPSVSRAVDSLIQLGHASGKLART